MEVVTHKRNKEHAQAPFLKVLVADVAGYDSIGELPYLFRESGCSVDVFCKKDSWLLKNSHWDTWVVPSETTDTRVYAQELAEYVRTHEYDWVIPGDDLLLRELNAVVTDEALFKKILPVAKIDNRDMIGSKAALSRLCTTYDLCTPAYSIYSDGEDIRQRGASVGFPLLVKLDKSEGGSGVFYCSDEDALVQQVQLLTPIEKKNLVLQKYIDGDIIALEVLYKNGRLLAYTYSRVTKVVFRRFGISSERVYTACPEIEDQLNDIGEKLGLNGFITMTLIREKGTNIQYLIEADLRPQVWFRLASFVGVDFSKAIQNFLTDTYTLQRPVLPAGSTQLIMWHFSREILRYGYERDILGILKWCSNWQGRWRFIPWYDHAVLFPTIKQLVKSYIRGTAKLIVPKKK